eukprot:10028196-Alexandrium_andersonii.AAC.1
MPTLWTLRARNPPPRAPPSLLARRTVARWGRARLGFSRRSWGPPSRSIRPPSSRWFPSNQDHE